MKNKKENKAKNKERSRYDKGQVFIKIMAGFLAALMLIATGTSIIYTLFA